MISAAVTLKEAVLTVAHVIFEKQNLQDPVEQKTTILRAVRYSCSDEEKSNSWKSITEAVWLISAVMCVLRKGLFLVTSSYSVR